MDFSVNPLSVYQQTVDAAQTVTQKGHESMQKSTHQTVDAAQKANTSPKR
jgi:hypothetical protein